MTECPGEGRDYARAPTQYEFVTILRESLGAGVVSRASEHATRPGDN